MIPLLTNPVYNALLSHDRHFGFGAGKVRSFTEEVSPFAGFEQGYTEGFRDLYELLPTGRKILYATPSAIKPPKNWKWLAEIKGLQFLYEDDSTNVQTSFEPTPLKRQHVEQMIELAQLTKPGPFGPRTIEFGHYYGVFENEQLVAMTGQRLHIENFTEISAVCTHPHHWGKGYASSLVQHQLKLILNNNQIPFLHVRADNQRAIAVYEKLGFKLQGEMNFYLLKK